MNRILIFKLMLLFTIGCSSSSQLSTPVVPTVVPTVVPSPLPQPVSVLSQAQTFLRAESRTRDTYWNQINALCRINPAIGLRNCRTGAQFYPHYTLPLGYTIRSASFVNQLTVDDQTVPIIRQSTRGGRHEGRIYYNAYIRQDVLDRRVPLKGVLIYAYGGASPILYSPANELSLERIMAAQGYLVYALNLRGAVSPDFDVEFIRSQGDAEGIVTTARDVTYFASILRNPQAADPYLHRPLYSEIIGTDPNIFLTGFSFGGYLSMYLATHDEAFLIRGLRNSQNGDFLGQPIRNSNVRAIRVHHSTVFDGYIPMHGVSDQREDVLGTNFGLTTSGHNRQTFFNWTPQERASNSMLWHQGQQVRTWMYNAFRDLDIIRNPNDNQPISPYLKAQNAQKPILLMHGLHDDNTSPAQSTEFAKALLQAQARPMLTQYYVLNHYDASTLGHDFPHNFNYTQNWYETMLRFMDLVSFTKPRGGLQQTDDMQTQNEKLAHTAYFYFRANHPNLSLRFNSNQFLYEQLIQFSNTPLSSIPMRNPRQQPSNVFWDRTSLFAPNYQIAYRDWIFRTRRSGSDFFNFFNEITRENHLISFQEIQNLENRKFIRSMIFE